MIASLGNWASDEQAVVGPERRFGPAGRALDRRRAREGFGPKRPEADSRSNRGSTAVPGIHADCRGLGTERDQGAETLAAGVVGQALKRPEQRGQERREDQMIESGNYLEAPGGRPGSTTQCTGSPLEAPGTVGELAIDCAPPQSEGADR